LEALPVATRFGGSAERQDAGGGVAGHGRATQRPELTVSLKTVGTFWSAGVLQVKPPTKKGEDTTT
jgi:hypothetical protein